MHVQWRNELNLRVGCGWQRFKDQRKEWRLKHIKYSRWREMTAIYVQIVSIFFLQLLRTIFDVIQCLEMTPAQQYATQEGTRRHIRGHP